MKVIFLSLLSTLALNTVCSHERTHSTLADADSISQNILDIAAPDTSDATPDTLTIAMTGDAQLLTAMVPSQD